MGSIPECRELPDVTARHFFFPKAVELGCCSLGGWRTLLQCEAQRVLADGRTWEAVIRHVARVLQKSSEINTLPNQ